MKILIDLDGTLLDGRARLHGLFHALVPESDLDETSYWDLKRAKVGHKQILKERYGYSDEKIVAFEGRWLGLIEAQEWLDRDVPFEGVGAHLQELAEGAELYLLTARQRPEMVDYQIEKAGLRPYFTGIFVTGGKKLKDEILGDLPLVATDWLVGDTGHDVEVGKRLGVRTAVVTDGFLSAESLAGYGADMMVRRFTDFRPELVED